MKKRLFVGIPISTSWRNLLMAYRQQVSERGIFSREVLRWTVPENLHVTICFLGSVEEKWILGMQQTLTEVGYEMAPFSLMFDAITIVPPGKSPRMMWLTFKASNRFTRLVESIVKPVEKFLRETTGKKSPILSDHKIMPHVTLARLKGMSEVVGELPQPQVFTPALGVNSFILYESHTLPDGPVYNILATCLLKGTI